MSKKSLEKFLATLASAHTEEEVKFAYAKYFDLDYDTSHRHDLYTKQVFFEFKSNKNFHNLKARSSIIAQTLYYIRRLKFGGEAEQPVPYQLCMADQNEAMITETVLWKDFYNDADGKYDWDLAPSTPDAKLVDDLASTPLVRNMRVYETSNASSFKVFVDTLTIQLSPQQLLFGDKKLVTEENFEDVFKYWNDVFGEAVRDDFNLLGMRIPIPDALGNVLNIAGIHLGVIAELFEMVAGEKRMLVVAAHDVELPRGGGVGIDEIRGVNILPERRRAVAAEVGGRDDIVAGFVRASPPVRQFVDGDQTDLVLGIQVDLDAVRIARRFPVVVRKILPRPAAPRAD